MALPARDRTLLLLPARIREGFGDGPLREVEHVGETERHEIAGKTRKSWMRWLRSGSMSGENGDQG